MIGDVITATLPWLRANAESLMTDTCDIDRQVTTWDESLQKSVTTWTAVHADVPCHMEETAAAARALLSEEVVTPDVPLLRIPVAFTGVEPDDRVTVGGAVLWVTACAPDDSTHPVELLMQCRRLR